MIPGRRAFQVREKRSQCRHLFFFFHGSLRGVLKLRTNRHLLPRFIFSPRIRWDLCIERVSFPPSLSRPNTTNSRAQFPLHPRAQRAADRANFPSPFLLTPQQSALSGAPKRSNQQRLDPFLFPCVPRRPKQTGAPLSLLPSQIFTKAMLTAFAHVFLSFSFSSPRRMERKRRSDEERLPLPVVKQGTE